jgi:hypothetical protein
MLLPSISNRKVISTRNLNEELSFIFLFRFISTFKPQLYLKNLKTLPFPEQPKGGSPRGGPWIPGGREGGEREKDKSNKSGRIKKGRMRQHSFTYSLLLTRVGIETQKKNFFSCDLVCLVVAYVFLTVRHTHTHTRRLTQDQNE